MSCGNSRSSKCNPCGPSEAAMNEIANKAAYYARIAQYASDGFSQVYLGAKETAPTTDNNGNPLIEGALYFNTTDNLLYVWDGSVWYASAFDETTPFLSTSSNTGISLEDRFAYFSNVKDFGAVGDGVANDSAAFDAAIASPTLGPVFVPKGDYNAGYKTWIERGVVSLADGNSKQEWLVSRKMTGNQGERGGGTFGGFSPGAYFVDLTEDVSVGTATGFASFVGTTFRHRYLGGNTSNGSRGNVLSSLEVLGKSTLNTQPEFVAFAANTTGNTDQNGIDTTIAGSKGSYFGGNTNVYLSGDAKNLKNVCGLEANIQATGVGHSSCYQAGIDIACNYKSRGAVTDAALGISGYGSGHIGYGAGILFSSKNGGQPFASDSTIIKVIAGPNNTSGITPSVFRGIDFSEYNITNSIIKGAQSNLTESSLTIGDDSGFALLQGGSQSINATLRIRPKGTGVVSIQSSDGSQDIARFDANINVCTLQNTRPDADATRVLGDASRRWSQVYAASGTINTSDAREKTFFQIEDVEKLAALEIKQNLRKFKFNSSIEEKGDNARIHFGASAQQIGDIMKSHGLDPNKYGFYCYDEWNEIEEQKDNEGNVIEPYRASGNRYGVRYEELLSFIVSAL
jgi:hypothetical protein